MLRIVERSSNYFLRPRLSPSTEFNGFVGQIIIVHNKTRIYTRCHSFNFVGFFLKDTNGIHKRKPRAEAPKTKSRIKEI